MASAMEAYLKQIADSQKDQVLILKKLTEISKDTLSAFQKMGGSEGFAKTAAATAVGNKATGVGGKGGISLAQQQGMGKSGKTAASIQSAKFGQGVQGRPKVFALGMTPMQKIQAAQQNSSGQIQNSLNSGRGNMPNTPQAREPNSRGLGFTPLGVLGTAVAVVGALGFNAGTSRTGDNYSMWMAGMNEGHGLHTTLGVVALAGDAAVAVQNFFRPIGNFFGIR